MPKMVCIDCQCELKIEKNGQAVIEMASFGPYKIWDTDTWKCPGCKKEIVAGFGLEPIAEHYQDHFSKVMQRLKESGERIIYDYEYPMPMAEDIDNRRPSTKKETIAND